MNTIAKEMPQPWTGGAMLKSTINANSSIPIKTEKVNTDCVKTAGFHLVKNNVELSDGEQRFKNKWNFLPQKNSNRKNEIIKLFIRKFDKSIWEGTEHNIWTERHNITRLKQINFTKTVTPSINVIGGESDWYVYNDKQGKWKIDYNAMNLHNLSKIIHDNIKADWELVKEYICCWGLSITDTDTVLKKEEKKYKQWQAATMSTTNRKKSLELLKSEQEMAKHIEEFDTNIYSLNTMGGVLDCRSGNLTPHRHDNYTLKHSPIEYDSNAECPRWLQFLNEVFDNDKELIKYIQRAVGYSLTGDMSEQIFFILNGSGSNGKSTFLDIIAKMLGDYHHSADIETFIKQYGRSIPQDLAVLKGARFVSSTEPPSSKYWDEDRIKKITGGDNLKVRYLHGRDFEYSPTYKLWFATNYKPRFQSQYAFTRRVRLIQFNQTFSESNGNLDRHLNKKLEAELSGILNWAVEGAKEYFKYGLGRSATIDNDSLTYSRAQDILQDFIDERIIVTQGRRAREQKVYNEYQYWCNQSGITHPISKKEFLRELVSRGFVRYKPGNVGHIRNIQILKEEDV